MSEIVTYTAFDGRNVVARGDLSGVVLQIKKRIGSAAHADVLIFNDETGKTMDFNFQGDLDDVRRRLATFVGGSAPAPAPSGPGRPKLGVVSREVSLLPRHWEWLAAQSSGASATLRQLVESAMKKSSSGFSAKQAQERTYRFLSVVAGDLEGYEEALRALYKKDRKTFLARARGWPSDVGDYAAALSKGAFED